MTNHYHLAVTTTEANLSRAVKQLNGGYAQWWNERHECLGHVFEARFKAQIVQDDAYLLNVCRYITFNPVRAKMVKAPEDWPWSSYRATAGLERMPSFLHLDRLMSTMAPDDPADGPNRFRRSVDETDADALQWPRTAIVGDDVFIARLQQFRQAGREIPRREERRTLDAIFQGAFTRSSRNGAIDVALRERYAAAEIARYLGLHPSTISRIASDGVRS